MGNLFGSSSKTPKAPDPYKTADAQTKYNTETAQLNAQLNRYDQTTPWGSLTWDDLGNNKWSSNVNLSPEGQQLLDADMQNSLKLQGATGSTVHRVNNTFNSGLSQPGYTPDIFASRDYFSDNLTNPSQLVDPSIASAQNALGAADSAGSRAAAMNAVDFNYNSAPGMPQANDAARQRVEDALYERMTSRLDPQFNQRQAQLESQLANQGITRGSEAFNTEMQNFGQTRNDAYQSAMNDAILAGGNELGRDFGMGMQVRQQGVNELNTLRDRPFAEATALSGLNQNANTIAGRNLGYEGAYFSNALNFGNQANAAEWSDLNSGQSQQIQARNQLLNELNALRTGNAVSAPQFQVSNPNTSAASPDVSGNIWNAYQGDLAKYNAGVNSNNALTNGLFSLGAAYLAGR